MQGSVIWSSFTAFEACWLGSCPAQYLTTDTWPTVGRTPSSARDPQVALSRSLSTFKRDTRLGSAPSLGWRTAACPLEFKFDVALNARQHGLDPWRLSTAVHLRPDTSVASKQSQFERPLLLLVPIVPMHTARIGR